ncbi:hypothetical protein BJ170DRAFT_624964 [Xylariales sp. AK1849]|nr:hypothetical protein BJ170DRAFT_624964 [Xylariales sp. AK1849]
MFSRMPNGFRQDRVLSCLKPVQNDVFSRRAPYLASASLSSTTHCRRLQIPKAPSSSLFAKPRFTPIDVPPLTYWKDAARPPLVSDLDPQECFRAINDYVDLAIADRPGWRSAITQSPHSLSPTTLHYIAAIIVSSPPTPAWNIAIHILYTLTTLNYEPSILTMVRLAQRTRQLGQPPFYLAEKKFTSIARRKDNANACTLQGLILTMQSTPEADRQALEWFRTAASIGGEEPGAWDWQASCALEMGKAYLRLNNTERARAIWEYCAKELDIAEGCWLYSTSLDPSDPARYEWVRKGAVNGIEDAAREMALYEKSGMGTGADNIINAWDRKAAEVLKQEWEAVAGDRAVF